MPTDFDWKAWKKRKEEPPPPPPEPEPRSHAIIESMANILFFIVVLGGLFLAWITVNDLDSSSKISYICKEQKGVAIRTIRGDAVCIKEDVLTDVLTPKSTNRAN